PEAMVFETGGNKWHDFDHWPPKGTRARNLFLRAGGLLAFEQAGSDAALAGSERTRPASDRDAGDFDTYVSDPRKPVPYTAEVATTEGHVFMVEDQRFVAGRPDVLVYETPPLTENLTIAGAIDVTLNVATTGTDGDWVVKVIDVYPGNATDPKPNPDN